jgi:hypothetical protein
MLGLLQLTQQQERTLLLKGSTSPLPSEPCRQGEASSTEHEQATSTTPDQLQQSLFEGTRDQSLDASVYSSDLETERFMRPNAPVRAAHSSPPHTWHLSALSSSASGSSVPSRPTFDSPWFDHQAPRWEYNSAVPSAATIPNTSSTLMHGSLHPHNLHSYVDDMVRLTQELECRVNTLEYQILRADRKHLDVRSRMNSDRLINAMQHPGAMPGQGIMENERSLMSNSNGHPHGPFAEPWLGPGRFNRFRGTQMPTQPDIAYMMRVLGDLAGRVRALESHVMTVSLVSTGPRPLPWHGGGP